MDLPDQPPLGVDEAVVTVVFDQQGHVLLHRRRDIPIWDLPGGRIEPTEAPEQAGVRETHEETGLQVIMDGVVGEFWRPQDPGGGTLIHVFRARVTGGRIQRRGPETLNVEWFAVSALPRTLYPPSRELIQAAARRQPPVRVTQRTPLWIVLALRTYFWLCR